MTTDALLTYARGDYQRDILTGCARWSGSDLTGKAKKYAGRYAKSRADLLARLQAAGIGATVGDVASASTGRKMRALLIDGAPVSAVS